MTTRRFFQFLSAARAPLMACAALAFTAAPALADGPVRAPAVSPAAADDRAVVKLLVRFAPSHPMGQAAALAARGDTAAAEKAAKRALRTRPELAGLCFDDFTIGGAEVVLAPCEAAPAARAEAIGKRWARYLRGLDGVAYVDQNVILKPVERR